MRNLIYLFARYGAQIMFVSLQAICFYLIVNFNKEQQEIFINSSNLFSGYISEKSQTVRDYFKLKQVNDSLMQHNARLLEEIINRADPSYTFHEIDSNYQQFLVTPATICEKTIHLRNNNYTLCIGKAHGVQRNMGVITEKGVVGITRNVSANYSLVIPLNSMLSRLSCSFKKNNFHGILTWKDTDSFTMKLEGVPKHADIAIGDSIVTSGFSFIFPKGIPVGVVSNFFVNPGSAFYTIDVTIHNDLNRISYVYVIRNQRREEIEDLKSEITQ